MGKDVWIVQTLAIEYTRCITIDTCEIHNIIHSNIFSRNSHINFEVKYLFFLHMLNVNKSAAQIHQVEICCYSC